MTFIDDIKKEAIINVYQQEEIDHIHVYIPEDEDAWIELTGVYPLTTKEAINLLIEIYKDRPITNVSDVDGGTPFL